MEYCVLIGLSVPLIVYKDHHHDNNCDRLLLFLLLGCLYSTHKYDVKYRAFNVTVTINVERVVQYILHLRSF